MTLMILTGVWALAFGHISVTQTLKMKGNEARIFGLSLIVVAAFVLPYLNQWFGGFMPKMFASNEALRMSYETLIGAFAIYGTAWVKTQVVPKLKIPSLTVSLKRQRA